MLSFVGIFEDMSPALRVCSDFYIDVILVATPGNVDFPKLPDILSLLCLFFFLLLCMYNMPHYSFIMSIIYFQSTLKGTQDIPQQKAETVFHGLRLCRQFWDQKYLNLCFRILSPLGYRSIRGFFMHYCFISFSFVGGCDSCLCMGLCLSVCLSEYYWLDKYHNWTEHHLTSDYLSHRRGHHFDIDMQGWV